MTKPQLGNSKDNIEKTNSNLTATLKKENRQKYSRFILAALGSIPWVGGFLSASAALDAEREQGKINDLHELWIDEHREKVAELGEVLTEIVDKLEGISDEIDDRIQSPSYLSLIRKGFRQWDQAETQEKKDYIRKLVTNAGATKLCPDDLIRLFLDWVNQYHEAHFLVIREIYKKPGITRGEIWNNIHGSRPREDSAEADLFKLLIRDLSTGSVIHQHRETDYYGNYVKKPQLPREKSSSNVMKSAFDDTDPYELTELGGQFVHYTMEDVVTRITNETQS